jgi:hypothetical protein
MVPRSAAIRSMNQMSGTAMMPPVPELRAGLGVGRDARRVVVGCPGDQARAEDPEQVTPPVALAPGRGRRARSRGRIAEFGRHGYHCTLDCRGWPKASSYGAIDVRRRSSDIRTVGKRHGPFGIILFPK